MNSLLDINRYRRKRSKVDASIFDSALSHTRRSNASEKKEENSVSTFGRFRLWRISSPRLYRLSYRLYFIQTIISLFHDIFVNQRINFRNLNEKSTTNTRKDF